MRQSVVVTFALAIALALSFVPFGTASAQDLPTAREQRQTLEDGGLPEAADLGSGWNFSSAFTTEDIDGAGFDVYEATYTERFGTRIRIMSALYDRSSEDSAVSAGTFVVENHLAILAESDMAPTARELRQLDDPRGCDLVARADGADPITYYYVGSLMCQDSANDQVLIVVVSGIYDGDIHQDAAESVLQIVLDIEPGGGVASTKE